MKKRKSYARGAGSDWRARVSPYGLPSAVDLKASENGSEMVFTIPDPERSRSSRSSSSL